MSFWIPAYIGIGGNVGDSVARVRGAFAALAALPECCALVSSRLYRTQPLGPVEQGDFINAAAGLLTRLSALDLLEQLRQIETANGRVRAERWGPRTLDLDLLVFGSAVINEATLIVPHPGVRERGFVLAPLADIAPTLQVPGMGRVDDLLARLPEAGIYEVLAP
jgi:2-amino-4-hydroxy-6-hydroxymethyldihydropteridine diphosphokinase